MRLGVVTMVTRFLKERKKKRKNGDFPWHNTTHVKYTKECRLQEAAGGRRWQEEVAAGSYSIAS